VTRFNLSEWALKHRAFVWYLMLAALAGGVLSYQNLGREEDPPFTIKTMIIQANWPGATVDEMINQVTDRIERKLEELGNLDFTNSYTSPGQTTVFVNLHENVRGPEIRTTWISVRNKIADIQAELPSGVQGPFFNDQFGDVYGIIYAFTADGLSFRQLRDYAEQARPEDSQRRQSRPDRYAGRGHLPRCIDQGDRRPWPRLAAGDPKPAGAECGCAIGDGAGRARACESAGQRPVCVRRCIARRQSAHQ
jgi:hypothetical protein